MFGTLYEPPSLSFAGIALLFAVQLCAIFVYKQASAFYRNQQLYAQYGATSLKTSTVGTPPGPAGPANGTR